MAIFGEQKEQSVGSMPDAALFAAHFLGACEVAGTMSGDDHVTRADYLMNRWHAARLFLDRVRRGEDVSDYKAMIDKKEASARRASEQKRKDEEGERARVDKARAEFGAKAPV